MGQGARAKVQGGVPGDKMSGVRCRDKMPRGRFQGKIPRHGPEIDPEIIIRG